jgi:dATP/dGTP diphosphohydrolase, N-terminal
MTEYDTVKDSGTRQSFDTGAVRDIQQGKGRFDLISPIFLRRLARHYENGARKYGDRNWERGIPVTRYLDSAMRHINEYREGLRDEDHLTAAAWNIACAIHTEEMVERGLLPKELMNNIPSYLPPDKPLNKPTQKRKFR